jgi:hypothetical protein
MYMALGASVTLVFISFGFLLNASRWSGFENYAGGAWQLIQLFATPPGFYLLLTKRWKALPLSNRLNTIFGYFVASWISLVSLGLITANTAPSEFNFLIVFTALLIALGYIWALKKTSQPRDEMFP